MNVENETYYRENKITTEDLYFCLSRKIVFWKYDEQKFYIEKKFCYEPNARKETNGIQIIMFENFTIDNEGTV